MENKDVLPVVIEKLDALIMVCVPRRQNWLEIQKKKHHDLLFLKAELISKEAQIASAIDAVCLAWVKTGQLPQLQIDDAEKFVPFVWDRFYRAYLFARWLHDGGCQIYNKGEKEVLIWLLNDHWKFYGRMAWRETSADSL
jgi:hypothetical protein